MCAASVRGCGGGKPHMRVRPLSLAALERRVASLLGSFAEFAEYTVTPYMEKTGERV